MGTFDQTAFNHFILAADIVGFFDNPVSLASGRQSHWYVNWRTVFENAMLTAYVAEKIHDFTQDRGFHPHTFYGVPEGATKIGLITQYRWAMRHGVDDHDFCHLAMGRGRPKDHGNPKDRYFLGVPQGRTIVIEDVTTTGDSLRVTLDRLLKEGVHLVAAYSLTNRMEKRGDGRSVQEAVEETGIPYFALSTAPALLPAAYSRKMPGREIGLAVEDEFKRYGVEPLLLPSTLEHEL